MVKTIGTDPEYFLVDAVNGSLKSSIGVIPGSKQDPFNIGDGIKIHPDNIAIELAVPPSNSEDLFIENINKAIFKAQEYLNKQNSGLEIKKDLVSVYAEKELLKPKGARTFGCEPDFNALMMEMNRPPSSRTNLRSCGGHIHVGLEESLIDNEFIRLAVLMMDIYLGVPSILLDSDTERRKLYGKASCFRPKDYGFEYRTLSNFWTKSEPLIRWAFKNTHKAIEMAKNQSYQDIDIFVQASDIINTQNENEAKSLITLLNIEMP